MVWSNKTVRKKHYSAERLQLDTPARLANTEEPCCSCHNLSRCEHVCRRSSHYISLKFWVNKPGLGASTLGIVT